MDKKKRKFIVATLLILGAVGYLVMTGINTGAYTISVKDVINKKVPVYDEKIRVQGLIVKDTIKEDIKALSLNFRMSDDKDVSFMITVEYKGPVPDMFEAGRQVVVEGRYSKDGTLHATTLLTSCPSKYEAPEPKELNKSVES